MQILTTQEQLRNARHVKGSGLAWQCADCGKVAELGAHDGCGTGYGYDAQNRVICYACCGARDLAAMLETGRACLYLTCDAPTPRQRPHAGSFDYAPYRLTNWPGTLEFKARGARIGRHNFAGRRYDVWFKGPDGHEWHGVTYGDNTQICHVRRTKSVA
jgi:hypothetical protein